VRRKGHEREAEKWKLREKGLWKKIFRGLLKINENSGPGVAGGWLKESSSAVGKRPRGKNPITRADRGRHTPRSRVGTKILCSGTHRRWINGRDQKILEKDSQHRETGLATTGGKRTRRTYKALAKVDIRLRSTKNKRMRR